MDRLSEIFSALADPTRREILGLLLEDDLTVGALVEHFPISQPAISRHLKVLERAGLIIRSRSAQWSVNHLAAEPLQEVHDWMLPYRRFWDDSLDRLDQHLQRTGKKNTHTKEERHA